MANDQVHAVLALFAAVAPDGGEGVMSSLRALLGRAAPFDEGELVLMLAADLHRRPLGAHAAPLAADDLIERLATHPQPVRIDDLSESAAWPATRDVLARRRMRSLMAWPLAQSGSQRGALVLVARAPCAFAGVSPSAISPLAVAAGLALTLALKLSGLRDEQEALLKEVRGLRQPVTAGGAGEASLSLREAPRSLAGGGSSLPADSLPAERQRDSQSPAAVVPHAAAPAPPTDPRWPKLGHRRRRH